MSLVADRKGNIVEKGQDRILKGLYGTVPGRFFLKLLVSPAVSKLAGAFLDSGLSRALIPGFVRRHSIDMAQFEPREYQSYNDFFTRKLAKGARTLDCCPEAFVSPCDSRVSVYPIDGESGFPIKNTRYTVDSLLRSHRLAAEFMGGYVWVFRLCVEDYHRYIYVDDGRVGETVRIPGVLHTVNPVAGDRYPVYKENTREYCLFRSRRFGRMVQMEVGAMLVGKIRNHDRGQRVRRGWEKGRFEFGGSTVILITGKDKVLPDADIRRNSRLGIETKVRLGERVGTKPLA
jgi:phosphatidylserine decarboxylase